VELAARLALLALLAYGVACVCGTSRAHADPRYGDSSWVAPAEMFGSDSTIDRPRVAPPDHERRWETVLRTPFRIVFFPLRLVAKGLEAGANYVGPRYFEPKPMLPPRTGFALGTNFTFGAVKDVGFGPSITWAGFPTADARMKLAGSWSTIDRRQVNFSEVIGERRAVGLRVAADYDQKPNRRYFGIGNSTPVTDRSHFLLESSSADAALHVGSSPLRQLRFIGGYSSMSARRGYKSQPLLEDLFTPASAPYEHRTTQELWYGVAGDLAALDDDRDPSLGVHGRVNVQRATGLRSSDPDYYQWSVEGRAYLPVFAKRRVIAVRSVYAGVEPSGGTTILPYYRLAQSQGDFRFAGFESERFRDRQLMLGRIEYRWEIINRMSAVALYELGEVAPRAGSFSLREAHASYGGGLRLGMRDETSIRFEVAKSVEGLNTNLMIGCDF